MYMQNQISQPLRGLFRPISPIRNQVKINFNTNPSPFHISPSRQLSPQISKIHQNLPKNASSKLIYFQPQNRNANQFNPFRIQQADTRTHVRVPASYKRDNIYYNRPGNRSQNSIGNNSLSLKKANIKAFRVFHRQGLPYQNPLMQLPFNPYPQSDQYLQSISLHHRNFSPPSIIQPFSALNEQYVNLNQMNFQSKGQKFPEMQNSIQSTFTFGQPRVPSVLKERKPRLPRLNSLNSQQGVVSQNQSNYVNKKKSTQTVSIYHRKNPIAGGPKNQEKAIVYNINIIAPKVLVKHTKTIENEIPNKDPQSNYFNMNNSYDINTMSPVNRTPIKQISLQNNLQDVSNYNSHKNSINNNQHKNSLPWGDNRINAMTKKEEVHNDNPEKDAVNNLMQQLRLNYDYFSKHQSSDRSISDHVLT